MFESTQSSKSWWGLFRVLVFWLGVFFLFFWIQYLTACLHYSELAKSPMADRPEAQLQAIVVLTGESGRIPEALELLRQGKSSLLIISGVQSGIPLEDVINQQVGASHLIHETWNKIMVEADSISTLENAEKTRQILEEKEITEVLLVTSEYHMPRALGLFKRKIPNVAIIPYPTRSVFSEFVETKKLHKEGFLKLGAESLKYILYQLHVYQ